MIKSYRERFPFERRKAESERIMEKYPNRVPIIVEIAPGNDIQLEKYKYLCPGDLTNGQFMYVIRKRTQLASEQALFLFVNNTLPATADMMSIIYKDHKDKDGFLYITISLESTFGCSSELRLKRTLGL